jgi:hypothetical protein
LSIIDALNFPDEIPYIKIQEDLADNFTKYMNLFLRLADKKSRIILDGLLKYRMDYDSRSAMAVADDYERQYFDAELINFDESDVFVDLGGFDGDTIEKYIEFSSGSYKKYICLSRMMTCLIKQKTA